MILAALILALIMIALLQRETAARGLKSLREEHDFSERVTEPLNPVELILRFSNRSRLPIPFLRYEERLPEGAELTEQNGAERNHRGAGSSVNLTEAEGLMGKMLERIPVPLEKR